MTNTRFTWMSGLLMAGLVAVICSFAFQRVATSSHSDIDSRRVTITTSDGIVLVATASYPVRNVLSPAVILLHDYGMDRHQWDAYTQKFLDNGFVTFSYDMRGFGESRLPTIPASQTDHLNSLLNDLPDVLAYLRQQPAIDPNRISIIGIGVGADVAYVASASNLGIQRAVLLGPVAYGSALNGSTLQHFSPTRILGIDTENNATALRTFMDRAVEPKQQLLIPNAGSGVILLTSTTVIDSLFTWLQQ